MGVSEILFLSVGLGMDAFAVAICKGLSMIKMKWKNAIVIALYFGIFQALMPIIGYFLGNRLKLTTKFEHRQYYQKLLENPDTNILSQAALETLAIIAYNEPITRMQVDKIRGVGSSQMIRKLVAKGLIKESGRSNLPGRPILYETTNDFLDYFGLNSIEDLPDMEKYIEQSEQDIEEEKDLYTSKYQEQA